MTHKAVVQSVESRGSIDRYDPFFPRITLLHFSPPVGVLQRLLDTELRDLIAVLSATPEALWALSRKTTGAPLFVCFGSILLRNSI